MSTSVPLPLNDDAERAILGSILLDSKAYDEAVANGIVAGDFFFDSHQRIFRTFGSLVEIGSGIDWITVVNSLDSHKELSAVGDVAYVSSLIDGVPDRPSIRAYARIVKEKSAQRKLIHACNAVVTGLDEEMSSSDAMGYLTDHMLQIQTGSDDAPALRVLSFSEQEYTDWERLAEGSGDLIGLTTGIPSVDTATTGINRSEFWLYAGPTGDGKTTLALQAVSGNCRQGIPVGMFSIEMPRGQVLQRLWCQQSGIPFHCIRNPRGLDSDVKRRVQRAMCDVAKWPLYVATDSSLSIQQLAAKARLLIRQEKVELLIVDHVQLVSAQARDERERVTKISNTLRALAKDTGVPIIAISQLSRPKDGSPNMRPNKFRLKESGALENDANVIVLTYRPVDEFGTHTGSDELIIAKQRNGPVGNECVVFDPKTLTFNPRKRTF